MSMTRIHWPLILLAVASIAAADPAPPPAATGAVAQGHAGLRGHVHQGPGQGHLRLPPGHRRSGGPAERRADAAGPGGRDPQPRLPGDRSEAAGGVRRQRHPRVPGQALGVGQRLRRRRRHRQAEAAEPAAVGRTRALPPDAGQAAAQPAGHQLHRRQRGRVAGGRRRQAGRGHRSWCSTRAPSPTPTASRCRPTTASPTPATWAWTG